MSATDKEFLSQYFHYEPTTTILSIEDPKFSFYLKNIIWRVFTRQVGYNTNFFPGRYDFALSFAGANRSLAEAIHEALTAREVACFYDQNEQHRIIAQNVEDYLAPIYRSEAGYVIVLQSKEYPQRIWTKFESDQFKERFGENAVIPIRFTDAQSGFFSDEGKYGGLEFQPDGNFSDQVTHIVNVLCSRVIEDRQGATDADHDRGKVS